MAYACRFYQDEDFEIIEQMVLNAYQWEHPVWNLSRHEFSRGLHPAFTGNRNAWRHTVGVFTKDDVPAACVINEGNYDGEQFFLFKTQECARDKALLSEMIKFAKTYGSCVHENKRTRSATIPVPAWNATLAQMLGAYGFCKEDNTDRHLILPFPKVPFDVCLPHGYTFADGSQTPSFFLSNVHRHSFGYGAGRTPCEHGAEAFAELRTMRHYRSDLELSVLDPQGMPVAMAIIWYDERMPYCELEPLAVVWWERRKGLGTTLLHELANRVMRLFPNCTGMLGGDQSFYSRIGYETVSQTPRWHWETDVIISWERESFDKDYKSEVQARNP